MFRNQDEANQNSAKLTSLCRRAGKKEFYIHFDTKEWQLADFVSGSVVIHDFHNDRDIVL